MAKDPALKLLSLLDEARSDKGLRRPPEREVIAGRGMVDANIMFVVGCPSAYDQSYGTLGVGRAGQVLMSLMSDVAKLQPTDWYLTSLVKYHCTPTVYDTIHWAPYLRREWQIIGAPDWTVIIGGAAWMTLGDPLLSINASVGSYRVKPSGKFVVPMLDPMYGLMHPVEQDRIEEHWEAFGEWFAEYKKGN